MKMCARMAILRRIAAAHMAALQAHAQMHPRVARLQALFASLGVRLHVLHVIRNVTYIVTAIATSVHRVLLICPFTPPDIAAPAP